MNNNALLLSNLVIRLNRADDAMMSQVFEDYPATPEECQRVHDRLLGAWSECLSARRLFSESERAKMDSLESRVTFIARGLRTVR